MSECIKSGEKWKCEAEKRIQRFWEGDEMPDRMVGTGLTEKSVQIGKVMVNMIYLTLKYATELRLFLNIHTALY